VKIASRLKRTTQGTTTLSRNRVTSAPIVPRFCLQQKPNILPTKLRHARHFTASQFEVKFQQPIKSEDTVNGYQVKKEFMPTLKKIIDDHGDIAKDCTEKSVEYRLALLELICGIILELKMNNLIETEEGILKRNFCIIDVI